MLQFKDALLIGAEEAEEPPNALVQSFLSRLEKAERDRRNPQTILDPYVTVQSD